MHVEMNNVSSTSTIEAKIFSLKLNQAESAREVPGCEVIYTVDTIGLISLMIRALLLLLTCCLHCEQSDLFFKRHKMLSQMFVHTRDPVP